MNFVKLWTRQDVRCLEDIEKTGEFFTKRSHLEEKFGEISGYVIDLYTWFVKAAEQIIPKPEHIEFPVWCSIAEESSLAPTQNEPLLELNVPLSEIIYFDGCKWDYALNHIYLPKDEADARVYNEDLLAKGFTLSDSFMFFTGKTAHMYPLEQRKIKESWKRVFDIDEWDPARVQANIWYIKRDWISRIYHSEN